MARRLLAPAAYVAVLAGMAVVAYWRMFNSFQEYDDEGYVELTLRHLLHGHALYDEINTQYGPFYYVLFGGFFKLTGLAISTNSGRLLQIAIWVLAALLCGLAAHRATRSALLGIATTAVTFTVLGTVVNEPMHPGGLLSLLVAAAAFVLVVVAPRFPRAGLAALGAVATATALVKINVGGFLLIACAFAAATALGGWPGRRAPRAALAFLFAAVAPILLLPDVAKFGMQNLALVVAAGAAAIVMVTWPAGGTRDHEDSQRRWWVPFTAGAVACAGVVGLVVLALGTTPAGLLEGMLLRPLRQRQVLFIDPQVPDAALLWAAASLTVAAVVQGRPALLLGTSGGAIRVAAGLALWFITTDSGPLTIGPDSSLGLAPVLVWIAVVPPSTRQEGAPLSRLVRIGLPAMAVLQTLHAYPVAGSQVGFASVLFPLVGAICIADGTAELTASRAGATDGDVRRAAAVGLTALAFWAVLVFVVRPMTPAHEKWRAGVPLPYEGATRLRLPAGQAALLRDRVGVLRSLKCQTIMSRPTYGSITMWAAADAPVGLEPDGWSVQLDDTEQRKVLSRLRDRPPDCGLRNEAGDGLWHGGRPLERRPAVRYLDSFTVLDEVGGYEILLPPARRSAGALTK